MMRVWGDNNNQETDRANDNNPCEMVGIAGVVVSRPNQANANPSPHRQKKPKYSQRQNNQQWPNIPCFGGLHRTISGAQEPDNSRLSSNIVLMLLTRGAQSELFWQMEHRHLPNVGKVPGYCLVACRPCVGVWAGQLGLARAPKAPLSPGSMNNRLAGG